MIDPGHIPARGWYQDQPASTAHRMTDAEHAQQRALVLASLARDSRADRPAATRTRVSGPVLDSLEELFTR